MVLLLGILSLTICIRFSAQAHLRELPKNIDEHPSREYTSLKRKQFRGRPVIIDTNNTNAFTVKENFPQNRIINGRDADPDMNSFFAMILQYNSTTLKWTFSGCGSSLITNCHVLTAAHCVVGSREGRSDGVLVRAWKPYNSNGGVRSHFSPVNSQSSHIKIHPKYNPKTNENDIAIIKMDWCVDPINFPPVDLAKDGYAEGLKEGDSLRASGFGRLFEGGNNALVETLQSVQLPYIPRDTCVSLYGEAIMSRDMICAGYAEGGTDTCIGDSGGPIVQDKEGHTTLVGMFRMRYYIGLSSICSS